jgi:2-aminoadipate transaminase
MDLRIDQLQRRAANHPGVIPLAGGLPADELLPRAELAHAMESILTNRAQSTGRRAESAPFRRSWPDSVHKLRGWIADRLNRRGARVDDEDVLITAGAQHALALVARTLRPGLRIAVGDESYPAAIGTFTAAQHDVICDGEADAHYVVEGVSVPHGTDTVTSRRDELLASGAFLIADEACVELRFDGRVPRPLYADAPDRVWHIGSFSKVICPGIGVGWLVPPRHARADVLARTRRDELQQGSLVQAALARLLVDHDHDERVGRARALYAERAAIAIDALRRHLPSWRVFEPEGGTGVWVESDLDGDDVEVMATAIANGVSVDPGCVFRPGGQGSPMAFRLSFAAAPLVDLEEGIRRLARATRSFRRCDRDHAA